MSTGSACRRRTSRWRGSGATSCGAARVGALVTRRSHHGGGTGSARPYGLDGTFAFFSNLTVQTYWAKTQTPGLSGDNTSYRANFEYNGDRYGMTLAHLRVGDNFLPEVGFVRRDNIRKHYVTDPFQPAPATEQGDPQARVRKAR